MEEQYQLHWHAEEEAKGFPITPDVTFLLKHWDVVVQRTVTEVAPGRVLDIACGNGRDLVALAGEGWEAWGLDPSPYQLANARVKIQATSAQVSLLQGLGERLPFHDGSFVSVMTKSALDHFTDGRAAMREIARVLQPDGRVIVTAVNYTGLACRLSRFLYALARRLRLKRANRHLFWDSPLTYGHHTVECTYPYMTEIGREAMRLDRCYGVSLLMGVPRWGWLLGHLPKRVARVLLLGLDRLARRMPRLADVVVCVWRPLPEGQGSSVRRPTGAASA